MSNGKDCLTVSALKLCIADSLNCGIVLDYALSSPGAFLWGMLTGFSDGIDNAENRKGFQHSDVLEALFVIGKANLREETSDEYKLRRIKKV